MAYCSFYFASELRNCQPFNFNINQKNKNNISTCTNDFRRKIGILANFVSKNLT